MSPSGVPINERNYRNVGDRVRLTAAKGCTLMTVHLPITVGPSRVHGGLWKMAVSNDGESVVRYSTSVISESTLRASVPPPQPISGTSFAAGDSIQFQLSLTQLGGAPVQGADVSVSVSAPQVDIDELLSTVTEAQLSDVPTEINGDVLSLRARKVIALQMNLGEDPAPIGDLPPFAMSGNEVPGTYSGAFSQTKVPGPYTFTIRVSGLADRCQSFQREFTHGVSVNPVVPVVEIGDRPTLVTGDRPTLVTEDRPTFGTGTLVPSGGPSDTAPP